jgi:CO/xanthine dehydrogenase FAD-binding subunit
MGEARKNGYTEAEIQVFYPATLQELFTIWNHFPLAIPFAGGVDSGREQSYNYKFRLPSHIISLAGIDELHRITRTERYIEIGSMVTLNEIVNLGKIVPDAFTQVLRDVAGPQVRNLATIGGHICRHIWHDLKQLDASAPLVALDARYEVRNAQVSRWISASRFSFTQLPLPLNPQELLTRIRIPLEPWNYSRSRKFRSPHSGDDSEGVMVFMARFQKDILSDIRMIFAGTELIRNQAGETFLFGKKLPLEKRDVVHCVELWQGLLSGRESLPVMVRAILLNFIESCLLELAD